MGNRAHVIFTDGHGGISPAIYLHWNGGPESVYRFIAELERRGCRGDTEYAAARFTQLVGEFLDNDGQGTLSLGVTNGPHTITADALAPYNPGDNGVYVFSPAGDGWACRRFVALTFDRLDELSAVDCIAERTDAMRADHPYREISEWFETLRARRSSSASA